MGDAVGNAAVECRHEETMLAPLQAGRREVDPLDDVGGAPLRTFKPAAVRALAERAPHPLVLLFRTLGVVVAPRPLLILEIVDHVLDERAGAGQQHGLLRSRWLRRGWRRGWGSGNPRLRGPTGAARLVTRCGRDARHRGKTEDGKAGVAKQ